MRNGVGMTGEITLRGQVLPVGGIKEKVLAAHRNALNTVILPKRNEMDLDDVPEEIKAAMTFIFAESVDDVINAALEPPVETAPASDETPKKRKTSRKKENPDAENNAG